MSNYSTMTETIDKEVVELLEKELLQSKLIVYNDDFNTFDWVIQSIVDVCGHNLIQAEQLSHIIHFSGKATVKSGSQDVLKPLKDGLTDRGLSAVIEQ
jgi:ATP-dependent Clp protease adaptor protein ClpS